MSTSRVQIPDELAAEILFCHDHTCCVCQERGRHVQIHHIDEDNSNNDRDNLTVLCTECHNDTQIRGGFGRRLNAVEVRVYRDNWIKRVEERRARADELAIEKQLGSGRKVQEAINVQWRAPSDIALYTFVENIPGIMAKAYSLAQPEWDKGATNTVAQATYQLIDVVEQIWIQLAAWYPPNQFGKPPAQYISELIAARFALRYALIEPEGPGTAGTMIRPMVAYGALLDAQDIVVLTVRLLLLFRPPYENFDIDEWKKRFEQATSTYNQ
jgi:hypothetical protein